MAVGPQVKFADANRNVRHTNIPHHQTMKTILLYCFLTSIVFSSNLLHAAEFAPVFVSGIVLQREMPVEVWGTGRDGESVTVDIGSQSKTSTVKDGRWSIVLDPMQAAEGLTLRLRGDNEVTLDNVAAGEVWIVSGQSNMEWRLNGCAPLYDEVISSAQDAGIRELKIPLRTHNGDPLGKLQWKAFEKGSAGQFGAVAYFFAAEMRRKLGVVVGIVNCSFGGTPIEAWMSREAIMNAGAKEILEEDERKSALFPTPEDYEKAWNEYQLAKKHREERRRSGESAAALGPELKEPYGFRSKNRPSSSYEAMLSVIRPYTARGVLWYQGENNTGTPKYSSLLSQLIISFRNEWKCPDWPFYIAQLSTPSSANPDEGFAYPVLREAQRGVARNTPNSGLVVTLDHGERGNVHPKAKRAVGERFARLALARVYGQSGFAAESPAAIEARWDGDAIVITFDELPGRIDVRDPEIPTLEVQDAVSNEWKPASGDVSADGKSLRIKLPHDVVAAKAVRYGWRNYCVLSLFTDECLPVVPWTLTVTEGGSTKS